VVERRKEWEAKEETVPRVLYRRQSLTGYKDSIRLNALLKWDIKRFRATVEVMVLPKYKFVKEKLVPNVA
jgi:hypothetical protein